MSTMGDLDPTETGEWVDALMPNVDAAHISYDLLRMTALAVVDADSHHNAA